MFSSTHKIESMKNGLPTTIKDVSFTSDVVYSADGKTLLKCRNKELSSYTIEDGTEAIGDNAFYDCNSLLQVTIPDSVRSIGNKAFFRCMKLESIKI